MRSSNMSLFYVTVQAFVIGEGLITHLTCEHQVVFGEFFKNSYAGVSQHEKLTSGKVCFIILGMSWVG